MLTREQRCFSVLALPRTDVKCPLALLPISFTDTSLHSYRCGALSLKYSTPCLVPARTCWPEDVLWPLSFRHSDTGIETRDCLGSLGHELEKSKCVFIPFKKDYSLWMR